VKAKFKNSCVLVYGSTNRFALFDVFTSLRKKKFGNTLQLENPALMLKQPWADVPVSCTCLWHLG